MPTIAERVAHKVIANYGEKEHKPINALALEAGASISYANNGKLTKTDKFQAVMAQWRDKTAQRLQKKTSIALSLITKASMSQHNAKDLMSIIDTGIKNTQLLSGGATERNESISALLLAVKQIDGK